MTDTNEIQRILEARPDIAELINEAREVLEQPAGMKKIRLAVVFLTMTGCKNGKDVTGLRRDKAAKG